jgi:CcmD family protein
VDHLEFLFAGFAVFWAGLFVYLLLLQARLRQLTREIERLEERLVEAEPATAVSASAGPEAAQGVLTPDSAPGGAAPTGHGG